MTVGRFILIAGLLAATFAGGWLLGVNNPEAFSGPPSENLIKATQEVARVVAQGKLVPTNGVHNVITAPGQRIESVKVSENDKVIANDTKLATLQGEKVLDMQTELVDAQNKVAIAELDQKILLAANNLKSADAAVESAQLQLAEAEKGVDLSVSKKQVAAANEKLTRLLSLQSDADTQMYVSASDVADQQLSIDQAQSQIDSIKRKQESAIKAAKLGLKLAKQSQTSATRALQSLQTIRKEGRSAELSEAIALTKRDAARIISPVSGTVLKVFARQGDVTGNLPLMQIGNLDEMQCVAEVVDRLVGGVKIGQTTTITSPAFKKPLTGKVVSIGHFVGQSTMMQPNPLALVDRKTVDVRIRIDDEHVDVANKLVNLQVSVEIETPAEDPVEIATKTRASTPVANE